MIISRTHRYLFVEIPNTGSTAIAKELKQHYGGERILHKHASFGEFLRTPEAKTGKYFVFACVRHPLDAAVTSYFKMRSNHRGRFTLGKLRDTPSVTKRHLELYRLAQDGAEFPAFFKELQTGVYNNSYLLLHERFDYVMRYEELQQGFSEVLRRLGIAQVQPIPVVNRTDGKSRNFWEFYTGEVRSRAMRLYWPYMRRWGYSFPAEWGKPRIHPLAEIKFVSLKTLGGAVSRLLGLGPNSRVAWAVSLRDLVRRVWS